MQSAPTRWRWPVTEAEKQKAQERKEFLQRLRKERSEQVECARELQKEKKAVRRKVKSALAEGPVTVPAVALAAEIETDTALWHITAMKKYGLAVEDGMDGDWPLYRLPESTEEEA